MNELVEKIEIEKLKVLISACLENDRRAQERLFKLYYGKLLVVVLRYITDQDSAEEVLQNGFIKIFDKLQSYNFQGSFEGWMRRIIVNTTIDSLRREKKNIIMPGDDAYFVQDAQETLIESEEMEMVEMQGKIALNAIQQLTPICRTVFNLFVIEGYSHKQIADKLGISEGTSKSNLARAKTNLKKIIEKEIRENTK